VHSIVVRRNTVAMDLHRHLVFRRYLPPRLRLAVLARPLAQNEIIKLTMSPTTAYEI